MTQQQRIERARIKTVASPTNAARWVNAQWAAKPKWLGGYRYRLIVHNGEVIGDVVELLGESYKIFQMKDIRADGDRLYFKYQQPKDGMTIDDPVGQVLFHLDLITSDYPTIERYLEMNGAGDRTSFEMMRASSGPWAVKGANEWHEMGPNQWRYPLD